MTAAHAIRCDQWSEVSKGRRAYEYRFTLPPDADTRWRRNMTVMILASSADSAYREFNSRWPDAEMTGVQLRSSGMDVIVVGD